MEGDPQRSGISTTLLYFNPLPPHGGRPKVFQQISKSIDISIHSLRMEGDRWICRSVSALFHFNPLPPHGGRRRIEWVAAFLCGISIHSLRMEGDQNDFFAAFLEYVFQSTPSAWRETYVYCYHPAVKSKISIHSLRMEGDPAPVAVL